MTAQDTLTLTDFLLGRIADDEAEAETHAEWREFCDECGMTASRRRAECEAKRRIVELYDQLGGGSVAQPMATALGVACKSLATVYADHPDYRDEWKP